MPSNATKTGAPEALGGEVATRASILQSINKLDEQLALEPFYVRQATINGVVYTDVVWNAGANRYDVTIGKGQILFPGAAAPAVWAGGTTTIPAPAAGTTYYLAWGSDAAWHVVTSAAPVAGQVIVLKVIAPNPNATPPNANVVDMRSLIRTTDEYALAGDVTGTPTATAIAAGAVTVAKLADEVAFFGDWLGL